MSLSNYRIESAGGSASGGRLISLYNAPAGPTGTASLAFAGSTGTYDVVIGYYDENDGVASLDVRVGGTSLSKWQLDQNLGSGSVSGRTLVRRTVAGGVSLTNGSLIEIQGAADQGEWARVDYIEFIPIATAPPPPSSVPGSLAFSAPQFRVNEDGTPVAVVTVTRTGGSAGAVSATVSLSNGTATAPGDYRNTSVVVNFADGDATTKTVVIPITDDALVEGTETVNLGLVNPTGGATIGTQSTAVLEIIDNDNQPIRVEAENMTLANYRVQLGSSFASNGAFISLNGGTTTEMGSASYTFTGSSGTYDVVLGYYDETDGISHLEVYKQGVSLDVRDLNQNRGNAQAGPQTLVPRTIATGLTINQGETITISAIENQGEPAGVDYIEFIPVPSSTINGTDAAETLIGDGLNNIINGFAGNDTLIGKAGNDGLYGGDGIDTASYVQATQGVIANLSSGVVFTPLYSTTLKTMPLGDSITYGVINSNSDTESGGYRTYLWDKFVADSLSVDFVGSMSNGPVSLGDKNHEGHRGWMIQDIANNIDGWLDTYKPDVIPLMIGTNNTNDVVSGNTIADRLGTLIDQIASRSPNTQLLVASIPPVDGSILTNERAQRTAEFNLALPNLVKSKVAQGKKVTFVDMRSELTLSDLAEGLHPNGDGYRKISDYWYDAIIKNSFDKDTLSSIENLVGSAFNDKLVGNAGVNTLEGGAGKDILTGGGSTDTFVYKNPIEGSDTITDFSSDDILHISASGFGGGLSAGTALSRTASTTGVFVSSANPTSIGTSANFLYNTSTGLLNFDRDGTGSGAVTAIAMLSGAPALDINQFTIIS
jgi:Ca2+-binding RTX toxin-like protein